MKKIFLLIAILIVTIQCQSQMNIPWLGHIKWINGYAREISGENIGYTSAYPDYATVALLTRNTDGNKIIEWETASVPKDSKGPYVYFSWVAAHSSGTSSAVRNYDLYIDDKKLLTFTTYPDNQKPDWTSASADSARLVFIQKRRDASNDAHGLAFLRLPISKVKPGFPVKIKVVGQSQNSNDWYMTFKFIFQEKVDIEPMPFVLKNGKQPIQLTALHFGTDEKMTVMVNHADSYSFDLKNGINTFDIPVTAVTKNDSVFVSIQSNKIVLVNKFIQLHPVIYRELDFIHHSHTDIGYSHLQPEVLQRHIKNIDDALHMIEKTKHLSTDARFKWNIESMWVVDHYLQQASTQQKENFIRAVKEGSICLSALYANILTGISEPEETFHYTDYAQQLSKQYGLTINSAMISDIPGFAWTTVTGLAKGGVKYFSIGSNFFGLQHPYLGDRAGHFLKIWGDKPVWWSSPSGEEKILFWAAAKGYSSWHGTPIGGVFERGPKKIAEYLNELTANRYPYEIVQWRYNVVSDNGPIDSTISDFVEQWNHKYASPRIVLNTAEKMFELFEKKYGNKLPIVKGDITPYWEDGAISTAAEEGQNRINSLRLQQLETLYSIINPKLYDPQKFADAWANIILFHEHTWGAYNSISEPDKAFVTEQWRFKKQYMLDADRQVNQLEKEILNSVTDPASKKVAVINTSSFKRTDPVIMRSNLLGKTIKDANGKEVPVQVLQNGNSVFIAADVPSFGNALYDIASEQSVMPFTNPFIITDSSLSNGKIKLIWDKQNGSIIKLEDEQHYDFAGMYNKQGLNSYWYVPGLIDPANAVTNNAVKVRITETGPVLTTISIISEAPGTKSLVRNISLYAGSNEVMIDNMIDKKAIREKESVHFGFPFNHSFNKTVLDAGYGNMKYITDQLPGSDFDYVYARRWMDLSNDRKGIQMMLLESPLIEPDSIIDERKTIQQSHKAWKKAGIPTSTWFSYVMNNYWHTNYKADQEGVAHFKYVLRPHEIQTGIDLEKAASAFTQPLVAIPINNSFILNDKLFELSNPNLTVTSITVEKDGAMMVRLFNPEQTIQQSKFIWRNLKPTQILNTGSKKIISANDIFSIAGNGVMEVLIN